jgi:Zn-dependent metalloprotease
VRTEGGAASTIADANRAYDYLGDTYSYYSTQNGRDSFDGAGAALNGVVRYCGFATGNNGGVTCFNASFNSSDTMYVGPGFAADDVIAHEVTHGVTSRTSKLAYQNASGAINESLSDIWGEFVDLQNGRGSDADTMRWQVGEDLSVGTIRSMKYPKPQPRR